jgi:hypothetical protein
MSREFISEKLIYICRGQLQLQEKAKQNETKYLCFLLFFFIIIITMPFFFSWQHSTHLWLPPVT